MTRRTDRANIALALYYAVHGHRCPDPIRRDAEGYTVASAGVLSVKIKHRSVEVRSDGWILCRASAPDAIYYWGATETKQDKMHRVYLLELIRLRAGGEIDPTNPTNPPEAA